MSRGVLTFVASGLDINGCVLSYFEGTANLHCYTSCTLTTLHCSKVSFLQCCHMKRYNKIFTKMWGVYSLLWDTIYIYIYIYIYIIYKVLCYSASLFLYKTLKISTYSLTNQNMNFYFYLLLCIFMKTSWRCLISYGDPHVCALDLSKDNTMHYNSWRGTFLSQFLSGVWE